VFFTHYFQKKNAKSRGLSIGFDIPAPVFSQMSNRHIKLLPGGEYHLLSRAVGSEKLFIEPKNYDFFLSRYQKHVSPIVDTYAYCLLPNHFHLQVKVKEELALEAYFKKVKARKEYSPLLLPDFVMERFANWLNSYAKSFNKMYRRMGALFIDYMRRVAIEDESQFRNTIFYIHKNPVHHYYCRRIEEWPWSSYHTLLSQGHTQLLRPEVWEKFGGREGFINFHKQPISPKNFSALE
jgi:putative transposase